VKENCVCVCVCNKNFNHTYWLETNKKITLLVIGKILFTLICRFGDISGAVFRDGYLFESFLTVSDLMAGNL
jgi:hypothetical protein